MNPLRSSPETVGSVESLPFVFLWHVFFSFSGTPTTHIYPYALLHCCHPAFPIHVRIVDETSNLSCNSFFHNIDNFLHSTNWSWCMTYCRTNINNRGPPSANVIISIVFAFLQVTLFLDRTCVDFLARTLVIFNPFKIFRVFKNLFFLSHNFYQQYLLSTQSCFFPFRVNSENKNSSHHKILMNSSKDVFFKLNIR